MKKLTVLLLLVASFAQAQQLSEPASYTVSKSGSGIKIASNKGLIKFFTSPVVTGEPRAIYPLNLPTVKFTQNGVTTEVPWTYVVNVNGSSAASNLAGLVDQLTALVSSTGITAETYNNDKQTQAATDQAQNDEIGVKLDAVVSLSSASTLAAQNGSNKLIIEIIAGVLTIYIYAATASPSLQKILTYN